MRANLPRVLCYFFLLLSLFPVVSPMEDEGEKLFLYSMGLEAARGVYTNVTNYFIYNSSWNESYATTEYDQRYMYFNSTSLGINNTAINVTEIRIGDVWINVSGDTININGILTVYGNFSVNGYICLNNACDHYYNGSGVECWDVDGTCDRYIDGNGDFLELKG